MRSRRKLRFRLVVTFALFGFGLSALFAVAALYVRQKVEDQLVVSALQQDADSYVQQMHDSPGQPFYSELMKGWGWSERTLYKAPLAWQDLPPGVHDMRETDDQGHAQHYKLAVSRRYGLIAFVQYDVSRDDLGKRQLVTSVVGAVFLFGLLSLVLGLCSRARC